MQINYDIEKRDLETFYWRSARADRTLRWVNRYTIGFVFVIFVFLSARDAEGNWQLFALQMIPVVLFFLVWCAFVTFFQRIAVARHIRTLCGNEKEGRGVIGGHSISINDGGIVESTAVNTTNTKFEGINRLEETTDHFLIYVAASTAHIIPKRAFGSESHRDEFWNCLKERVAASRKLG